MNEYKINKAVHDAKDAVKSFQDCNPQEQNEVVRRLFEVESIEQLLRELSAYIETLKDH